MHRPVLLFSLGSSQPADPQITAEEKTFWMRTHCGFSCQNSEGQSGCVCLLSGQFWISQVMELPWVHDGAACAVRDVFRLSRARLRRGYFCEIHLALCLLVMVACHSGHCGGSSEKLELAPCELLLRGFIWMKSPFRVSFPRGSKLEAKLLDAKLSQFSKIWAF